MPKYARANPAKWWKTRSVGSGHRSPAAMFISPLRRYTSLLALLLLASLIGGVWYVTNPQRISRLAQILLTQVLGGEDSDVVVGEGHLSFAGTLRLSGVELRTRFGRETPSPIFSADQVEMRFDWLSLLTGRLRATQITAIRPTLSLVENRATQHWNYERLRPSSETRPSPSAARSMIASLPVIILREARVQWGELDAGKRLLTARTTVDAQLSPDAASLTTYRLEIEPRPDPDAVAPATVPAADAGEVDRPTRVTGTWDIVSSRFSATIEGIVLGEGLVGSLPRQVRQWWQEHQLTGRVGSLVIAYDPPSGLVVTANFDRVSMIQRLDAKATGAQHDVVIPIRQVRGTMQFNITQGDLTIRNLQGEVFGFRTILDAHLRGTSADAPFELAIRIPKLDTTDGYPEIMEAFEAGRDLIARLRPRGTLAVAVSLKRPTAGAEIAVDGIVDCLDVKARFIHFPYPMEHAHGRITFDSDVVRFHKVTALADGSPVVLDGSAGIASDNKSVDFTVSSEGAVFDERMASCLKPRYRDVWRSFNPLGVAGFTCRVFRDNTAEADDQVTVDVTPRDVSVAYEHFPYPLRHAHGHFTIKDEETTIEGLTAQAGPGNAGEVTFKGIIKYPRGGDMDYVQPEVDIEAHHVPVDRTLLDALSEDHQGWARRVDLTGTLDLAGHLTRNAEREVLMLGTIKLSDTTLRPRPEANLGAWSVQKLNTEIALVYPRIEFKKFTGQLGTDPKSALELTGVMDESDHHLTKVRVRTDWRNLVIQPAAPVWLPEVIAQTWTQYQPAGPLDGDLEVALAFPPGTLGDLLGKSPVAAATQGGMAPATQPALSLTSIVTSYLVHLRPEGMSVSPAVLPEPVTEMRGELTLRPGQIDIGKLTAHAGPIEVATAGSYRQADGLLDLAVKASAETLPSKWLMVLPGGASSFLGSLKPEGGLVLDLKKLSRQGRPEGPLWRFDGAIGLTKFKTEGSFNAAIEEVKLVGRGQFDTRISGLDFDGSLNATQVTVGGKTLDTLQGRLLGTSASKALALTGIDGKIAGGTLQGDIVLRLDPATSVPTTTGAPASQPIPLSTELLGVPPSTTADEGHAAPKNSPRYEATLVLNDAELAALILPPNASAEERKRIGTGRVTANLAVQEQFGQADNVGRTGRGDLVVRDGTIYDVPLALGLMQIVTLRLPVSHAFNSAQMSYYLRDNKVTFERIVFGSEGINLAGSGTLTLPDRNLDLRFLTESPNEIQIPILTPLTSSFRNQLLQLHITGPIEAPKIQPMPLDALSSTLEHLLPRKGTATP